MVLSTRVEILVTGRIGDELEMVNRNEYREKKREVKRKVKAKYFQYQYLALISALSNLPVLS